MSQEEPRDVEAHARVTGNDNETVLDENDGDEVEAHGAMRQDNETVLDEDDGDEVEAHGVGRQDNETVLEDEETAG